MSALDRIVITACLAGTPGLGAWLARLPLPRLYGDLHPGLLGDGAAMTALAPGVR